MVAKSGLPEVFFLRELKALMLAEKMVGMMGAPPVVYWVEMMGAPAVVYWVGLKVVVSVAWMAVAKAAVKAVVKAVY